jgi:hypothetical protein
MRNIIHVVQKIFIRDKIMFTRYKIIIQKIKKMLARYTNKDLMICKNLKGTENYKNMKKKQIIKIFL